MLADLSKKFTPAKILLYVGNNDRLYTSDSYELLKSETATSAAQRLIY